MAMWYLLTVAEDNLRNLVVHMDGEIPYWRIAYYLDRYKYALKYCLGRVEKEAGDRTSAAFPIRAIPMIYTRAFELLSGGVEYSEGVQICSSAHAGSVRVSETSDGFLVTLEEQYLDKHYAALELLGRPVAEEVTFVDLLFHWIRTPAETPPVVRWIAERVAVKGRRLLYMFDARLAVALVQEIPQPPFLIPDGWRFDWGGRTETTLLINALVLRCFYHVVAVHFGALLRGLRGGGESELCLCIGTRELMGDMHLMCSLDPTVIEAFVATLIYGAGTKSPDPALQPLVPLPKDRLLIPCILFISSHHERNLLSLQARVQTDTFNAMSSRFEERMTARLDAIVRTRWPLIATNKTLQLGGDHEEIDVLVADPESQTLLVCELRWMLPPGDPREVLNRKQACWQKVDQLQRKVLRVQSHLRQALLQAFELNIAEDLAATWNAYGVVVIEGFGGARSFTDDLPVLTTTVFAAGIEGARSLRQFACWARSLSWLPREDIHFAAQPSQLQLGGMNVEHPGLVPLQGTRSYLEYVATSIASFQH
jgi:hypothetical protein